MAVNKNFKCLLWIKSGQDVRIESDSVFLNAFSQCWEIRRLQLEAIVHDLDELDNAAPSQIESSTTIAHDEEEEEQVDELELLGPNYEPEYVGVDDEGLYLGGNDDDVAPTAAAAAPCTHVAIAPSVAPNVDVDKEGGEGVDDADWEGTEDDNAFIPIVIHGKKNPVMKVGTTFSNIHLATWSSESYADVKPSEQPGRHPAAVG